MRPAALTLGLLAAACTGQGKDGPVEVKFDRDACRACSMIISDRHFVAEVRGGERREVSKFDDIGCALKWLDARKAPYTLVAIRETLEGPLTLGTITVGCACGYLDLRFAADRWRQGHPKLAAWYEKTAKRKSFLDTVPKDPA